MGSEVFIRNRGFLGFILPLAQIRHLSSLVVPQRLGKEPQIQTIDLSK